MSDFASSRAGARNVVGVGYQLHVGALLLLKGIEGEHVSGLVPEGDEDIDVILDGGGRIYVQAKFRSRVLSTRDLKEALLKAITVSRAAAGGGTVDRVAIVSNAVEFAGLSQTGWNIGLDASSSSLKAALLIGQLNEGLDSPLTQADLRRIHLVTMEATPKSLASAVRLRRPAFTPSQSLLTGAFLVSATLEVVERNREATRLTASQFSAHELASALDRGALLAGAWLGAIESRRLLIPTDFLSPPAENISTYLSGVHTLPAHIGAGYALPREKPQREIEGCVLDGRGVVIAGPSGSGKSTLLWQTAAKLATRMPCFTLTKVDESCVSELVSLLTEIARQPVVVCVDDFTETSFPLWDEFLASVELNSNVRIIVSCRDELFDPSMLGRTLKVVRASLDETDAISIVRAARQHEISLADSECRQIYQDGQGLMMEIVHIAVTSDRLVTTLSEQGRLLTSSSDELPARLARLILTADLCGFAIPLQELRSLAASDSSFVKALKRLEDEHIVILRDSEARGLHTLRSRHLVTALHAPYPPLRETLHTLIRIAPVDSLVEIARLWTASNSDAPHALADALADRFANEPHLDWNALARVALVVECIIYGDEFRRSASVEDRELAEYFLLNVGEVDHLRHDGALADLGRVHFGDPRLRQRIDDLRDLNKRFETLPPRYPFRREIIRKLRHLRSLDTHQLSLAALEYLRRSECFTAKDLEPLMSRVLAAYASVDPELDYEDWPETHSRENMSRAWAARAAAGIVGVGTGGAELIASVLGNDGVERARWALNATAYLVDLKVNEYTVEATLVVPPFLTGDVGRLQLLRRALNDAAAVGDIQRLEAILMLPDGEPADDEGFRIEGRPERHQPGIIGTTMRHEYIALKQSRTWFEWIDELANQLIPVCSSLQRAVSVLIVDQNDRRKSAEVAKTANLIFEHHRRVSERLPEPPDSRLHIFDSRDHLASWAFGTGRATFHGFRPAPEEAMASATVKRTILSALEEFIDALSRRLRVHAGSGPVVRESTNDDTMQPELFLRLVADGIARFPGSRAQVRLRELADCMSALYLLNSADDCVPEFASERLTIGIAPTMSAPGRAVERLLGRAERLGSQLMERERLDAEKLQLALGEGWDLYPIGHEHSIWGSAAPLWLFAAPPSMGIDGPHMLDVFARHGWADKRSLVAFRTPDGQVRSMARPERKVWPRLSSDQQRVAENQLSEAIGSPSSERSAATSVGSDLRFLVLIDAVSRELATSRLQGVSNHDAANRHRALSLAAASGPETMRTLTTRIGLELSPEFDPKKQGPSLADRLSRRTWLTDDAEFEAYLFLLERTQRF